MAMHLVPLALILWVAMAETVDKMELTEQQLLMVHKVV